MLSLLAIIGSPFIPGWDQLRGFVPELCLIGGIVAVLLTPFFTSREGANRAGGLVALGALAVAFLSLLLVGDAHGEYFRGLLVNDPMSTFWKGALLVFVIGVVLMWFGAVSSSVHPGDGPEFFTLLLGATLGMMLMAGTANLLMLFMVVELASLPSYVLAGFRKTHRLAAEASLKYVVFGAATSAVMVYGLSIAYGMFGTLQIEEITRQLSLMSEPPLLAGVALIGLLVGLAFKISAVPFHFWCPDVFEGAGIDVTTFLSVASKGAALVLLLRVVMLIGGGYDFAANQVTTALAALIAVVGCITATWGNTAAFTQRNIKRLLAYSSIAHAGYILCALSLVIANDMPNPAAVATQAVLLYLAVYLFMNLGAFTVAGLVARETGSEDLSAFSGLGRRSPVLAAAMAACLVSLVGLPPLAGFLAKWVVMVALFQNGGWWIAVVVVIGVNTVLSLYYYARVIRVMYLEDRGDAPVLGTLTGQFVAVACAVMLLLMLVAFAPLDRMTRRAAQLHGVSAPPPVATAE